MEAKKVPTLEEAKAYIYSIDFSRIINKMVQHQGWLRSDAEKVCEMYRNFMFLRKKYGKTHQLPPSEDMDEFWHVHILDTKKYRKDCDAIYGEYIDHYPYFGIDEVTDFEDLGQAFVTMQELYAKEFNGAEIYQVRNIFSKIAAFFKGFFRKLPERRSIVVEDVG